MLQEYLEIFKAKIDGELLAELLDGGKIIHRFLLEEKGFIVVERETPKKFENGLCYKWVSFEYSPSMKFYSAVDFIESLRRKEVIKRAHQHFRD